MTMSLTRRLRRSPKTDGALHEQYYSCTDAALDALKDAALAARAKGHKTRGLAGFIDARDPQHVRAQLVTRRFARQHITTRAIIAELAIDDPPDHLRIIGAGAGDVGLSDLISLIPEGMQ